jgi:hypothetical protein
LCLFLILILFYFTHNLLFIEKMVLLSFALGWYSGIYTNQTHPHSVPVPTAESALSFAGKYSSSTAIKPVSFLQEIENQVWNIQKRREGGREQ